MFVILKKMTKALGKSKCTDPGLSHPFYFKALAIIPSMWCKHVAWKCETVIPKIQNIAEHYALFNCSTSEL